MRLFRSLLAKSRTPDLPVELGGGGAALLSKPRNPELMSEPSAVQVPL